MELKTNKINDTLVITARGRLDASWTDLFLEQFLGYIRQGDHHLLIEAEGISFLSSAGIRALVRIHKELIKLQGTLRIVNANSFVANTLQMTGFGAWLTDQAVVAAEATMGEATQQTTLPEDFYLLSSREIPKASLVKHWMPWQALQNEEVEMMTFSESVFGIGTGGPVTTEPSNNQWFGDFLAVDGHLIFQSPEADSHPDFLLREANFLPRFQLINALLVHGQPTHLMRFKPADDGKGQSLSELICRIGKVLEMKDLFFVMVGESDGLVGAQLIQSPGKIGTETMVEGMALRDWVSFTCERVFPQDQVMVVGFAAANQGKLTQLMHSMPSADGWKMHAHAAVFPFQPLQNGLIHLEEQVKKILNGPPPKALLHLVDDNRALVGLGESRFLRGALWFAALNQEEVL